MARPDFPYSKLPGARHGIFNGASLWMGTDHILHVKNTRFAEEYHRYYLNDIQAIYLEKRARFLPPPVAAIAIIAGLIAQIFFAATKLSLAVNITWIFLLAMAGYAAWLCVFRSCICSVETALGTERLSCLTRLGGARAALELLENRVREVQGPEDAGLRVENPPVDDRIEPPRIPQPTSEQAPRNNSKEQIFGWLALPSALISAGIVMRLPAPIPNHPFIAAVGVIAVEVVFAVLALIAGRGGARFRAVQGGMVTLLLISALELYSLVLINIYSQPLASGKIPNGKATLSLLVSAAHLSSVWLAGASVAAVLIVAVLLIRDRSRGLP